MTSNLITTSAAAELTAAVAAALKKYITVEPTLTLAEAAEELGVSQTVMRQYCRERKIRAIRLEKSYRIRVRDLNAFLDERTVEATGSACTWEAATLREAAGD